MAVLSTVRLGQRVDPARAVVPPPRLHASPFAFDADDAGGGAPVCSAVARKRGRSAVTRIDAAK
jgi:hypothetical protein